MTPETSTLRSGSPDPARAAIHPARDRILVIDDDTLVGKAIGIVLRDFKVVFAQSAAGALGRVASGRGFAAVVCDYQMPGMNGIQFLEALRELDPDLCRRVVFVTGWADAPEFAAFLRRTGCPCLAKPFEPEALRAAVAGACALDLA
jgi:two-component system C4-dicarboxylate transport response regulator DctD